MLVPGRLMWRPAHPGTVAHPGLESSVRRQDTFQLLAHENLNNAPKNVRKSQGQILQKYGFPCTLWVVQGSLGIVV